MSEARSTESLIALAKGGGPLSWMTKNKVAANLLMVLILLGGFIIVGGVKQEVFPEFSLNRISVSVPYPGASPEEVEQGILLALEEAIRGLDGVKEIRTNASEGAGSASIELFEDVDANAVLSDVKNRVDSIRSFPENIERPVVSLALLRNQVLSMVLYGDLSEKVLYQLASQARDDLLMKDDITVAELSGVRPPEISIEIGQDTLRAYNLTLAQVANKIRATSVEVPSGALKTSNGEILLRTDERRFHQQDFEDIILISRGDGTQVTVGDIARVDDGFVENDQVTLFDDQPAAMVSVYRVGKETPIGVADAVRDYIQNFKKRLPEGVGVTIVNDRSEMYRGRVELLMRNAKLGLVLVLLTLGMFLEPRLAFWVTLGIPVSFLGSLMFMPSMDVSINMISLFAFIITLGVVVDDAIVVGESIHNARERGIKTMTAAIAGVREVAVPVSFSILTTVVAFAPLLFVPGVSGKFFRNIPVVVISVLIVSLIESLVILPAHLSHSADSTKLMGRFWLLIGNIMRPIRADRWLRRIIDTHYRHLVSKAVQNRFITIAIAAAILMIAVGVLKGGHLPFRFLPKIERDEVKVRLDMPFGTPAHITHKIMQHIVKTGHDVLAKNGDKESLRGCLAQSGARTSGGGPGGFRRSTGSHLASISFYLVPSDQRGMSAATFSQQWRDALGEVVGAEKIRFVSSSGPGSGSPISVDLSHTNSELLHQAATLLATQIGRFEDSTDVDDGIELGKEQFSFTLKAEALSMGFTPISFGRQLRAAYFGAEAVRQQRGRDEVRAYVRLPRKERSSEFDLGNLIIRSPAGQEILATQAAHIRRGRAYTMIRRFNGGRVLTVSADVVTGGRSDTILSEMRNKLLPRLQEDFPGLVTFASGQQRDRNDSMAFLGSKGMPMALFCIFGLLAVVFKSYWQPLVVMLAIPFGLVGALIGHVLMGYSLSFISIMGIVAASGIVVNDSLVLVDAVNRFRQEGMSAREAVVAGGIRRFRPILLTSLTTFWGLAPMILETSMQARFLVPMAISLAFGVMFSTIIILLLVPATYVAFVDTGRWLSKKSQLGANPPPHNLKMSS
jgi:multidrug efflux pump subunit AcrB